MKRIYVIILITAIWIGCADDDGKLNPSDIAEFEYKIPQGNHDYDERIVDWFERCGFYILYKFEPRDVYFNVDSEWAESYVDTTYTTTIYEIGPMCYVRNDTAFIQTSPTWSVVWPLGYQAFNAYSWYERSASETHVYSTYVSTKAQGTYLVDYSGEAYVGKQLEWVEEMFLNFYPDDLLRAKMPLKLILGSRVRAKRSSISVNLTNYSYYTYFSELILSHGDESLDALTTNQKNTIKTDVNKWFCQRLGSLLDLDDFFTVTDYYWIGQSSSPAYEEYYALGLLAYTTTSQKDAYEYDFEGYLKAILSTSYAELTAEPADSDYDGSDFTGILHPKKDVNGKIREKYDAIIKVFRERGVDLQAIGNLYH